MLKRASKVIAVVCADDKQRKAIVRKIVVDLGFAITPGDAGKIVRASPHDFDMSNDYFIFADYYNFRKSPMTSARLCKLALTGMAVVVGCTRLPEEYEPFCEACYSTDFTRI